MEVKTAKPNPEIISALHNLFSSTCKFLAPTGLKYLVAIDLKNHLGTNERCYRCSYVSPAQAAVVIALCLLNADLNVSVLTANALKNLEPVNLSPSMTVQKGVQKLKEVRIYGSILVCSLRSSNISFLLNTELFFLLLDFFLKAKMQKMKLFASLDWAVKYKKKYDVFVFITDIVHKEIKNIISYLQKYREEMNVPDAK